MRAAAWGLLACLAALPLPAPASGLVARVQVFKSACSQARPADVRAALERASQLLQRRCGLGLSLTAWTDLNISSPWCHLSTDPRERRRQVADLARAAKQRDPNSLAFFLLPSDADERFSWALVDASRQHGCGSPKETRFLDRFGSAFFTDLAWEVGRDQGVSPDEEGAILVAHEVLHCLTQRGHPTRAPRGAVMADSLADMGEQVDEDWCACARQSPYLTRLP